MKFLIVCLLTLAVAHTEDTKEWEQFKWEHDKKYDKKEDEHRKDNLAKNKKKVDEHNANYIKGKVTYKVKVNHLSDMDPEEVSAKLNGFGEGLVLPGAESHLTTWTLPKAVTKIPENKDWRLDGAVTPVKNQGACGSCWAFSVVGSLEGHTFLKTGKLTELSPQNLIDCVWSNFGCGGGSINNAFQHVWYTGGIDMDSYYPYTSIEGPCRFSPLLTGTRCTGIFNLPPGDEETLRKAVGFAGPVSVAIDASKWSFMHYGGGVYDEPTCNSTGLNHAVLIVGYGSENNQDYWLVKNSWGSNWGENGYIRMSRNKKNQCGIANCASFPVV